MRDALPTEAANDRVVPQASPPPSGLRRWTAPGWLRAVWCTPLVGALGVALVCVVRAVAGWHPVWAVEPLVTVALVTVPTGFLIGIGVFDYWARYAAGKPTVPEDHSGHGAR